MAATALTNRASSGLKDFFGRGMNPSNDVYKLPGDSDEHERLTMQHQIWKLVMGGPGLYPPDIQDMVEHFLPIGAGSSSPPSILDLGSGSGIWAAEMAAMYPHTKVLGLDLVEPKLQIPIPSNCSFAIADLSKDLDKYANSFDIVHCRTVACHVPDRKEFMHQITKVIKPGGLLLLCDGDFHLFAPDGSCFPVDSTPESPPLSNSPIEDGWLARWRAIHINHMKSSYVDPELAFGTHLDKIVHAEPGLNFIEKRTYFSPARARPGRENESEEQELVRLTQLNIIEIIASTKPLLLSSGKSSEMVDDWERRAKEEVLNLPAVWSMRWDYVWATKKDS